MGFSSAFRFVVCVLVSLSLVGNSAAIAGDGRGGVIEDEPFEPYDPYDVVPIRDSILIGQHGIEGSVNPNPSAGHIAQNDVFISIPYVDSQGTLFDAHVNVTKKTLRIMQGSTIVGIATITEAEAQGLRDAILFSKDPESAQKLGLEIIVMIVIAVVTLVVTIAHAEYEAQRDCDRGYQVAMLQAANQMQHCLNTTGNYDYNPPSRDNCGADMFVGCK